MFNIENVLQICNIPPKPGNTVICHGQGNYPIYENGEREHEYAIKNN